MKKLLAFILSFLLILSTFSVVAFANDTPVAKVGDTEYTDIQEAIKAAAPDGTVEILSDVTVDKWIMIAESLTIGNGNIITLKIDGMTINGNGHTLTINSIESAGNGNYLFFDATNLNINDLTIKYADGLVGGIGLKSGTISDVTFDGGVYGIMPQTGDIEITGCTFKTNGTAIYFESERDGLTVTGNTFECADTANAILLRGDIVFTDNTIVSARTVNVVSGSPVVTGNNFGNVRFKVYNAADATIENNIINVLAFNDETQVNSTFANNTLSEEAQAVLDAAIAPYGSNSPAYTKEEDGYVRVWGEGGGNAKESFVLKLYSEDTLIATTTLNNIGGILNGNVYVTWNFYYPSSNDEYWTTVWEEGHPNSLAQPTKVELWIDGVCVATTPAKMSGADDLNPVNWAELGGVKNIVTGLNGEGTKENPFVITNKDELVFFAEKVNNGEYTNVYATLGDNIDLGNEEWTPIGNATNPFKGTFDGKGYTISNLKITHPGTETVVNNVGLFGKTNGATIKNFTINNANITGSGSVAAVVGNFFTGTVSNVNVTGNIQIAGYQYVGGIFGWGYGKVENCQVIGDGVSTSVIKKVAKSEIYGSGTNGYVGGIVGWIGEGNSVITGCTVKDITITTNDDTVGGISGILHYGNSFTDCTLDTVVINAPDNDGYNGIVAGDVRTSEGSTNTYSVTANNVTATADGVELPAIGNISKGFVSSNVDGNVLSGTVYNNNDAVAKIGTTYYNTLAEAVAAAQNGDTVVLVADVVLNDTLTIPAGLTVTIDLNGKTISQTKEQTSGYQMILNDGNLTIDDSVGGGKISYTDSGNGGEYISDTIYNRGNLVIEGGTIENLSSATVATNGYPHAVDTYSGIRDTSVTINGGTIYCASYSAIRMFCVSATYKADLVINGGTIKGAVDMQNGTKDKANGTITVNGGTFEKNASKANIRFANWNGGATEYGISAIITGGTFDAGFNTKYVPAAANWNNKIISGGTFGADITDFCAEGYIPVDNGDGTYGVKEGTFVAYVGEKGYETLAEAVAAAQAGDTIKIMAGTYSVPTMKAGVTYEGVGEVLFEGTLSGTLEDITLKNLHIKGSNAQRWAYAKGDLVFENVTFEATGVYALHFDGITEGATLLYKDCTIIGWAAMSGSPASCVFDGCTIKGNGSYGLIRTYFDATIENCTFDVANVNPDDVYQDGIHAVDATVTVNNCTNVNGDMKDIIDTSRVGYIILDGETIHFHKWEEGETVAPDFGVEGYTLFTCPCGAEEKRNIQPAKIAVAQIGETKYETLAEAVAAAQNGDTITLLTDVVLSDALTIPSGLTVTIDLNGYTITGTDTTEKNFGLIQNNGTLTINDSVGTGAIKLTATVNSGWNRYSAVISNNPGGKLTVNGGTLEHLGGTDMAYGIDSLTNGTIGDVSVTINGGKITSPYRAIRQFLNSDSKQNVLTINGGIIESSENGTAVFFQDPSKKANNGTITIGENAEIYGNVYLFVTAGSTEWPVEVSIAADALKDGSTVTSKNVPTGYVVEEIDGSYTTNKYLIMVTYPVGNPVYPEGKVEYYNDMREAVPHTSNCPRLEGATITLLGDMSGLGMRFMENGMVFDLNGYTYTLIGGTGSQGTETSGFQIRPEVTETATIKNGTIKIAEGVNICWMFNSYATNFVVDNVIIDCTNLDWDYGTSCYALVSRAGDNVEFTGNTTIVGFNSEVAGSAINVGDTMTIGENVNLNGTTIELDADATLTAPADLKVVTVDGYEVVYKEGVYSSVVVETEPTLDTKLYYVKGFKPAGGTETRYGLLLTIGIDSLDYKSNGCGFYVTVGGTTQRFVIENGVVWESLTVELPDKTDYITPDQFSDTSKYIMNHIVYFTAENLEALGDMNVQVQGFVTTFDGVEIKTAVFDCGKLAD